MSDFSHKSRLFFLVSYWNKAQGLLTTEVPIYATYVYQTIKHKIRNKKPVQPHNYTASINTNPVSSRLSLLHCSALLDCKYFNWWSFHLICETLLFTLAHGELLWWCLVLCWLWAFGKVKPSQGDHLWVFIGEADWTHGSWLLRLTSTPLVGAQLPP